jgi:hypothetical protein
MDQSREQGVQARGRQSEAVVLLIRARGRARRIDLADMSVTRDEISSPASEGSREERLAVT